MWHFVVLRKSWMRYMTSWSVPWFKGSAVQFRSDRSRNQTDALGDDQVSQNPVVCRVASWTLLYEKKTVLNFFLRHLLMQDFGNNDKDNIIIITTIKTTINLISKIVFLFLVQHEMWETIESLPNGFVHVAATVLTVNRFNWISQGNRLYVKQIWDAGDVRFVNNCQPWLYKN